VPFTYYGKYRFVFIADGYERMTVDESIKSPWWSYFPLDFFVENILPITLRDVRFIQKPMEPAKLWDAAAIKQRADEMRARGLTIGQPLPPGALTPPLQGIVPPPGATVAPPAGTTVTNSSSPLLPGTTVASPPGAPASAQGSPLLPGATIAPQAGTNPASPLLPGTTIAPLSGPIQPVPAPVFSNSRS
jgi:hypothetical protein